MIHRSPLPDVEIPDLPLTSYVLAGAQGDKPALIDGVTGQTLTYADLDRAVRSLAGGLVASGFGKGDVLALMAPNVPEYAVVFHGAAMAGGAVTTVNPTYTERELHDQLRDCGARILVTIPSLMTTASRACAGTQVAEIYVLGEADGAQTARGPVRPAAGRARTGGAGRRGGPAVLLGDHGAVQGRHAHPAEHGGQHRADTGHAADPARRAPGGGAAVLPYLRHAGPDELRPARRGDGRHAAPVRPRAVPAGSSGLPDHPVVRGAAHRARAGQAPARGQLRPQHADADPLRGRAAEDRPGRRVRQAAGLRGGPGLRDDRAVAGLAYDTARLVQAGVGGRHGTEHTDTDRRSGQRGGRRRRRRGRNLGARAAGDEGLSQQPAGHGGHDRCRRVAAHR